MERQRKQGTVRWDRWLFAAGAALLAGIQTRHLLLLDPWSLAGLGVMRDDAFFYSVLARNFQKFGFLTLDGEMPTNGVQPLWMLLQILSVRLLPWVHEVRILAVSSWLFYVMFVFSASWFAYGLSSKLPGLPVLVMAVLVLDKTFQRLVVAGLETPLMLTILILTMFYADYYHRRQEQQLGREAAWRTVLLAFCVSACFLVRTDLFWFPVVTGAWLLRREKKISRQTVLFVATVGVMVIPYLVYNYLAYHSLVPISGRVKVFFMKEMYPSLSSYLNSDEWLGFSTALTKSLGLSHIHRHTLPFIEIAVTLLFLAGQILVWRSKKLNFSAGFKLLSAVALAHLLFMKFVYLENRRYSSYYFSPEVIWFFLLAAYLLSASLDRRWEFTRFRLRMNLPRRFQPWAVALAILLIAGINGFSTHAKASVVHRQRMAMMQDVDRLLPSEERVGVFWPGLFAQFSGHPTTPMDGVIGSEEYFEKYIKTDRELDYLRDQGIDYFVLYLEEPLQDVLANDTAPRIASWTHIGTLRVWQNQHQLNVVSIRPTRQNGAGWYLLHVIDS